METVVVPANRVERAARVMALRYRVAAVVMLVTGALLLGLAVMTKVSSEPNSRGLSSSLGMFAVIVAVPVVFALLIRRRVKRIAWIGAQAAADLTILWLIDDYRILATDELGTPKPELAFKVTPLLRRELLGSASATLR